MMIIPLTRDLWSYALGSMDTLLPRRESPNPSMDSGPREPLGVGMGVAAVRMMMGGASEPLGSTWPLADIISILSSVERDDLRGERERLRERRYLAGLLERERGRWPADP